MHPCPGTRKPGDVQACGRVYILSVLPIHLVQELNVATVPLIHSMVNFVTNDQNDAVNVRVGSIQQYSRTSVKK